MNKKLTNGQVRKLKERRDKCLEEFNRLDAKIKQSCKCSIKFRKTNSYYITDTLGNNGHTESYDYCTLCQKYHEDEE